MDDILERLSRQAGAFSGTIERARLHTRAIGGKLRNIGISAGGASNGGISTAGVPSLHAVEDKTLTEHPDEAP